MAKRVFDEETRNKAVEMYKEGLTLKEIEEATGVWGTLVCRYAREAGCQPRMYRKKKNGGVKCRKCGNRNPKGSNFCNACGNDMRTVEVLLLRELEELRGMIMTLHNKADIEKADEITRKLIKYVEKKGEEA